MMCDDTFDGRPQGAYPGLTRLTTSALRRRSGSFSKALACGDRPRRAKPLLYVYRVLLTGIQLMRTGVVNANLVEQNEGGTPAIYRRPHRPQTIRVLAHGHHTTLEDADVAFHQREYERLRGDLQATHDASQLSELPSDETRAALNSLLVRIRLKASERNRPFLRHQTGRYTVNFVPCPTLVRT
jgi:predicted nucleotidyltransferase